MEPSDIQNILLTILTSIITGGFILVFVEIGIRKNRENDRYEMIMRPFMHKLSAYFRFVSWCSSHIIYPKKMGYNETEFKRLEKQMSSYGAKLITSGGDYYTECFSAETLNKICLDISNIWYYHDKMNPCNLNWDNWTWGSESYIAKELKEIFPQYLSLPEDISLLSKVSGHFYTEIYQPIERETYRHEDYIEHFKRQTIFISAAVILVLITLGLMLFMSLPIWAMKLAGSVAILLLAFSLILLGVDMKRQIGWVNHMKDKLTTIRKVKNMKTIL